MITVLGWYGHRNVGDESYRLTFPTIAPEHSFVFSDDPPPTDDVLILGGGNVLDSVFIEKAIKSGSKRLILSASITSTTPIDLLVNFSQIFVRDLVSLKFLESKGVPATFMPDLAFLLEPSPLKGRMLLQRLAQEEKTDLYQKKIGVVINAHLMQPGKPDTLAREFLNFQKVCGDLSRAIDNTNASFIFIPMCTDMPHDDRISNGIVASKCKFFKKNLMVQERLSVQETLDLISSLDGFISTRLHSTIFSVISALPFVDIVHHDKNKNILDTIGLMDYGMSYWEMSPTELKARLDRMVASPEEDANKTRLAYQQQLNILKRELQYVCLY